MSGRIPRDFIDDLISRSDIVDVIDSRVKLKKAGKNYQACCPFHNEKTPSFTVSQDKQFYHCFGCGAHGNVITFLMEHDRLEFVEAIEELSRSHGIEVPRESGKNNSPHSDSQRQQKQSDYELMQNVSRFFQHQLKHHEHASKAIDYLKARGLSGEIVKQWEIGYAPPEWDSVLKKFGQSQSDIQRLFELKLISRNDNGKQYDFFRDRIMFPIRDRRGNVVGFGGRIINDGQPKYLNSPETRLFHKGQELYGLYQCRQSNQIRENAIVVEGYMDVVALSQFGINNATAALGTATTTEHIQLLLRNTKQIICCFDGDRAGREAAWRALQNALTVLQDGLQLQFLFLPDGEDPDSMVRAEGEDGFKQRLDEAKPLSEFFFQQLVKKHSVGTAEGKAGLKSEAIPMIESIPGEHQKQIMMEMLSQYTGEYDRYKLNQDIAQASQKTRADQSGKYTQQKMRLTPLRTLVRLLLDFPSLAMKFPEVSPALLNENQVSGIQLLHQLYDYCFSHPNANTAQIIEYFRDSEYQSAFGKILQLDMHIDAEDAERVYKNSFSKLIDRMMESRMDTLIAKSRSDGLNDAEKQELALLMKSHKDG